MSRPPDLISEVPGFVLRNGFWMRECGFLQLAVKQQEDGQGIVCQTGILDPFARDKAGPFFVQVITLEGEVGIRTSCLPWRDGDVSDIAKALSRGSKLDGIIADWIKSPTGFLDFAIRVIEQWNERAVGGSAALFGWLAKKGTKTPPLTSYVLSLLFFHAGNVEKSLLQLERFRSVLSPDEVEQREWRESHFRSLIEKRAGKGMA